MNSELRHQLNQFNKDRKNQQRRRRIISVLGVAVAFFTIHSLILPAITMEKTAVCGFEEHTHTEECYVETTSPQYSCNVETAIHSHNELCYDSAGNIVCALQELAEHTHSDDCYTTETTLTCLLPEDYHRHTDGCIEIQQGRLICTTEETEGHAHGDECYETAQVQTCTLDESEEHTHSAECFTQQTTQICTLEEAISHSHSEGCYEQVQNIICGIEENLAGHQHTELCYTQSAALSCTLPEITAHTHNENCVDCTLAEIAVHNHTQECVLEYTTEQTIVCGQEEHQHTEECYPPQEQPQITYICEFGEHTHTEECPEGCTIPEHIHTEECIAVSDELPDTETEGIGPDAGIATDAADIVHPQGSVTGSYLVAQSYKYYQYSPYGTPRSDIMTLVLIPQGIQDWSPDTLNWSAKKDANYLVAYNTQPSADIASDAVYTPVADNRLQKELSAIVAHAYPFITLEQMQAELKAAYEKGQTATDLSRCTESELLSAVQTVIWQKLHPDEVFNLYQPSEGWTDETIQRQTINPVTVANHSENDVYVAHCEAISSWLMAQSVAEELTATYKYITEKDDNNLYTLTVQISLNRPVTEAETVTSCLSAGEITDEQPVDADTATLVLTGLTADQLADAQVTVTVDSERMQTYTFESETAPALVSGRLEEYRRQMAYDVTADLTQVSVTNQWPDGETPQDTAVQVQLYANGEKIRETAQLTAENSWSYIWAALDEKDSLGNTIEYAVIATPVQGYNSNVQQADTNRFIITNEKINEDIQLITVSATKDWQGRPDGIYPQTAAVQLMQNDNVYGQPVILNAENSWSAIWTDLPQTDNEGNLFNYTVSRTETDSYITTQSVQTDENGNMQVAITDKWTPQIVPVQLQQKDYHTEINIAGAEYDVYLITNSDSLTVAEDNPDVVLIPGTEDVKGVLYTHIVMDTSDSMDIGLPLNERFWFTETQAPFSYNLPDNGFAVTATQSDDRFTLMLESEETELIAVTDGQTPVITVYNMLTYILPETGGTGTFMYYTGGLLLIVAVLPLLYKRRNKKTYYKKEREHI